MVQTRSKYRLLQANPPATVLEQPIQRELSTTQAPKRKRKNSTTENYEDLRIIQITADTTDSFVKQYENDPDTIHSTAQTSMLTSSHDNNENNRNTNDYENENENENESNDPNDIPRIRVIVRIKIKIIFKEIMSTQIIFKLATMGVILQIVII